MGNLITLFEVLDFIAWGIFFIRWYIKEEGTIKSIIGWIVTAAIMCILKICDIMVGETSRMTYAIFYSFLINLVIAVCALIRWKRKKVKNK